MESIGRVCGVCSVRAQSVWKLFVECVVCVVCSVRAQSMWKVCVECSLCVVNVWRVCGRLWRVRGKYVEIMWSAQCVNYA